MLHKMYSVYDSKAEAYLPPFFASTKGVALRRFITSVNDPDHQFAIYPGDYTLFEIGEYDDQTGQVVSCNPISLGVAVEFTEVQPAKTPLEQHLDRQGPAKLNSSKEDV